MFRHLVLIVVLALVALAVLRGLAPGSWLLFALGLLVFDLALALMRRTRGSS